MDKKLKTPVHNNELMTDTFGFPLLIIIEEIVTLLEKLR